MKRPSKYWVIAIVSACLVAVFIFNDSFRATLNRHRAIRSKEAELQKLTQNVMETQSRLAELQKNPDRYEELVRKELGYLRPGEKEIRFLKSKKRSDS